MTLLDANVLLYAYDQFAAEHERSRDWLARLLSGTETVGLPWVSAWAFIRISTNPRLTEHPLAAAEAITVLAELRENPLVVMVNPGRQHQEILLEQMSAPASDGVRC